MENPYVILKRFIKWEILDLEAIIETIDGKNDMVKRRLAARSNKQKDEKEYFKL